MARRRREKDEHEWVTNSSVPEIDGSPETLGWALILGFGV